MTPTQTLISQRLGLEPGKIIVLGSRPDRDTVVFQIEGKRGLYQFDSQKITTLDVPSLEIPDAQTLERISAQISDVLRQWRHVPGNTRKTAQNRPLGAPIGGLCGGWRAIRRSA
jgi:hypothetical protein